jgi:hypothetical protein
VVALVRLLGYLALHILDTVPQVSDVELLE